jgi:hypothetical protein
MSEFKVGDRVRMKEDCQCRYLLKGEEGKVVEGYNGNFQVKGDGPDYCSCQGKWELVKGDCSTCQWNGMYCVKGDCHYQLREKVELEVGDEVECVKLDGQYVYISKGNKYTISQIGLRGNLKFKESENLTPCWYNKDIFKLIKKGGSMCGQEKSLRDRIEALTGWDKEADDIIRKLFEHTHDKVCGWNYYIAISPDFSGKIKIINGNRGMPDFGEEVKDFDFSSQCSKLRAFKDALLFLLDQSGIEKSKVKSALEAEVKELKDKLAGLERKIEEVGR